MSENNLRGAASAFILVAAIARRLRRQRRPTHPYLLRRPQLGAYNTLINELIKESPEIFRQYVRMKPDTFFLLLDRVRPFVEKQDTHYKKKQSQLASDWQLALASSASLLDVHE